jgi:hypothetical protein
MFDDVSFSDHVLLFHTSASASQSGAGTALRHGGVEITNNTITLGSYGPFALPPEVRDAKEFQHLLALNDNRIRVRGLSKAPRKRPDWPILTYAYRLYADHAGVVTDRELPPSLAQMIEAKRLLWNAMCQQCEQAIERGQTITADVVDPLAADVTATFAAFKDAPGRSIDRISYLKDDGKQIPARRVGA